MRDPITQVHIPRTGGTALREAMRGYRFWRLAAHDRRLRDVTGHAVVTVRDPVARFVSACVWGRMELATIGYRDPDAVALDLRRALGRITTWARVMFAPQRDWLDSADYVRERCLWVGHTETLDADLPRLLELVEPTSRCTLPAVGDKGRNASPHRFTLGPVAAANVRDWYADDAALLAGLT